MMRFIIIFFVGILYCLSFSPVQAQILTFLVDEQYDVQGRTSIEAVLKRVSPHGEFYFEREYMDILSESDRERLLKATDVLIEEFETVIYPKLTALYGEIGVAPGGSSQITVVLHRLVPQAAGYVNPKHLYPRSVFSQSLERNIIYLNIEKLHNPNIKAFLAHELQHIISFYHKEKRFNQEEDVWLNEIRSEYTPTFLGYDEAYQGSNLEQRVSAFVEQPTDSLTEWKGTRFDYGVISIFGQYLVGRFGNDILQKSLHSSTIGIESLEGALRSVGYEGTFFDVFRDFAVAAFLNDCTVEPKERYCFKNQNLQPQNLKIRLGSVGAAESVEISNFTKDWQGNWYEFSTIGSQPQTIQIAFSSSDPRAFFRIPYILRRGGKPIEVREFQLTNQTVEAQFENFGNDIISIVVMPLQGGKRNSFSANDPSVSFSLSARVIGVITQPNAVFIPKQASQDITQQQVLIQQLQEQIRILKEELNRLIAQRQLEIKSELRYTWQKDLFFGMRNDGDVRALQKALQRERLYSGPITGNFLSITMEAVIKFQHKYGIPAIGRVGPTTRAKLNELYK